MSSTQARTTSPTSWRRASRPTDSAMTRIASCGSMKQSGLAAADPAGTGQVQRVRTQLIDAQAPERHEQFIAARTPEAGEREALEQALEATLGTPARVAREGDGLSVGRAARAHDPLAVCL